MLPPTHPCLATFSGPSIPPLSQLPFRFLTPSVLTSFRPSQFWVLTTKPLFFFSLPSRFRLTVASPVPVLALAFLGFPFLSGLVSRAFLPIVVLSFLQFLSPTLARPTVLLQRPGLPFRALAIPLCSSLQVRLLGFRFLPFGFLPVCPLRDSLIMIPH